MTPLRLIKRIHRRECAGHNGRHRPKKQIPVGILGLHADGRIVRAMRDSVQNNLRLMNPPDGWWRSNCLPADLATDEHRWTQISDFCFPSAREMAWIISLAAFSISAFAFPLSGAHSPHGDKLCQQSGMTP
jgi:hypothetical protein